MTIAPSAADLLDQVAALQTEEGYAENGDVRIHYRTYGSGPAIVFQHGFPDTELSYLHQIAEFARDHRVITPTLRGFPPSSVPASPERYPIPELVSDVGAVLDHLGVERAVLAGHDWGGVVLQAFALTHAERVTGLVILNSPVLQPFLQLVHSDAEQQRLSEYTIPYLAYEEGDDKNIDHVVRHIRDPWWRSRIAAYLAASPMHGMLSYYKMGYPAPPYGRPVPEDVSAFVYRVPALIVWGLADPYFSLKHLAGLWDWFAQSYRFVSVPGAGHWVHQDAPAKVNREIRSWLEHGLS
ncbi:alpha/beta fold hydrolase [Amycolatopsis sp. NPDC051903]|uniref:alpha/beta fold hydrolase n=1 Tax=Amycolatopsis sp. NPDC051903 TaxID=3363936 RepID=UPI003796C62A